MISRFLILVPLLLTLACTGPSGVLPKPEPVVGAHYHPPTPESWDLPNGLKIMYLPDEELPLVDGVLVFKGGSYYESSDQVGLSGALGYLMRGGGAGRYTSNDLDIELERIGAGISSNFGAENGKVAFSCLSSDLDHVFELFADVAFRPRFEAEKLELYKGNLLESISRRGEDPSSVISASFQQLVYPGLPYGRMVMREDVARITRPALIEAYKRFVRPTNAILAVSGKIKREKLEQLVRKYFVNWSDDKTPLPPLPKVLKEPNPGIYFIELPFAQSNIYAGQLGVARHSPDEFAINGFNYVFGSSVDSELFRQVRTRLGLAYGIEGAIVPAVERGINVIALSTKSDTTDVALVESLKVLSTMRTGDFAASRLSDMQRAVANSFIFNFSSPAAILRRRAAYLLYGYPDDYDQRFLDETDKLVKQDLIDVARKYWDFNKFVIVIVGDKVAHSRIRALAENPPAELGNLRLIEASFTDRLVLP